MKTSRRVLVLGLCALFLVSFTLALVQRGFAEETTLTGTVRGGKLWVDKERYTLSGPYGDEVAKLKGRKVEVTGRVDRENMTIEVTEFKDLGPEM